MTRWLKVDNSDWAMALLVTVLLGLSFWLSPTSVAGLILGSLITVGALWGLHDGLRERWRASDGIGSFLGYYGKLVVVATVVLFTFLLSFMAFAKYYIG